MSMDLRNLGNTDLYLSAVGLGTSAIGWPAYGWAPGDDGEFVATIRRALELGVNWIDTAAVYGWGHAEEMVGRAIAGRREEVIVATKCGLVWEGERGEAYHHIRDGSIRREIEDSLRRLNVEAVDLYQIHHPVPEGDIEEAWAAVADLVGQGKVRYAGVSNFTAEQIRRLGAIHPIASLQTPYSLLGRGAESELLGFCADNGIGVIAYGTLGSGLLTGKYNRQYIDGLPENDWRASSAPFRDPMLAANLALVDGLRSVAMRRSRTVAQIALAWVLRRSEVTSAIVGARRPSQIEETALAGGLRLTDGDFDEIEALLGPRQEQLESLNG
jgi:aryl-alcohol dehydrogenase-like predicted oxidoreductase